MRRTVDQQPAGPPLRSEGLDGAHPVVLAAATKVDGHRRAPPLLTQLRRVHRRPRSHGDQLVPVGQHLVHGDVLVRRLGHTRHLRLGSLRAVRSRQGGRARLGGAGLTRGASQSKAPRPTRGCQRGIQNGHPAGLPELFIMSETWPRPVAASSLPHCFSNSASSARRRTFATSAADAHPEPDAPWLKTLHLPKLGTS